MPSILVAGEALMDCIPLPDDAFRPIVGGSPFNVAVAAARLGRPATGIGFMSGISTDFFGDRLVRALHAEGIDTTWVARLDAPTTLAFVDLSGPSPRYAFYDEKSATRSFTTRAIPGLPNDARFVHVGSVSLIGAPGADEIAQMAHAAAGAGRIVSVDPNVRASLVANDHAWRARLDGLMGIAAVVKLSDEDLEALEPGMAPSDFATRTLAGGASLVIVTGGGSGAEAWTPTVHVHVAAPKIVVTDTIGAGDTLMAATLVHLAEHGLDSRAAIAALDSSALHDLLAFATRAAAVTCTRAGCNPPLRHEV
jgi:fructokinase